MCAYTFVVATKTISIDLEAYARLTSARQHSSESFSKVIKRASWKSEAKTSRGLMVALEGLEPLSLSAIRELDRNQRSDEPPDSAWEQEAD